MATKNVNTNLATRVAALGYRLIVSDKGEQFVLRIDDAHSDIVFAHQNDGDDELVDWLDKRESGLAQPGGAK